MLNGLPSGLLRWLRDKNRVAQQHLWNDPTDEELQAEIEEAMADLRRIAAQAALLGPRRYEPAPRWKSRLRIYWYRLRLLTQSLPVIAWQVWIAGATVVMVLYCWKKGVL